MARIHLSVEQGTVTLASKLSEAIEVLQALTVAIEALDANLDATEAILGQIRDRLPAELEGGRLKVKTAVIL